MHLPHDLRWPFLGQIENFQMLMTFWVIMNKSQGEAISKRKKRCNSIMLNARIWEQKRKIHSFVCLSIEGQVICT